MQGRASQVFERLRPTHRHRQQHPALQRPLIRCLHHVHAPSGAAWRQTPRGEAAAGPAAKRADPSTWHRGRTAIAAAD